MGKILFYPFLIGVGHLNICLALSKEIFRKYGDKHEIYMIVNENYKEKLSKKYPKIKFVTFSNEEKKENDEDKLKKEMGEFGESWKITDRVKFVKNNAKDFLNLVLEEKKNYPKVTSIVETIKPDIILCDQICTTPNGIDQGIPFAYIVSAAPTFLGIRQLPPLQSGLPTEYNEENFAKWEDFIKQAYLNEDFLSVKKAQNDWLKEKNCETVDSYFLLGKSPFFNVYNYPTAVDYFNEKVHMPGNWLKLESAITLPIPAPFELPEKLLKLKGKLIYISMGSFSSAYKPLMDRLISIISQLPYRFILSAGVYHEEFNLNENIFAEKFVDQLAVLQSVELMISHGGNNTFTECFYFGVPQIILPLFADQIDNAARIKDKGLGETFGAFECTKEDLINAIEKLTTQEMKQKYKEISSKIQKDNSIDKVCEKIVSYCN